MDRTLENAARIVFLPEYLCKRPVHAALIESVEERDYGNEVHLGLRLPDTSRTFVAKTPEWAKEHAPKVGDYYVAQLGSEHLDTTLPAWLFDQMYKLAPSAAPLRSVMVENERADFIANFRPPQAEVVVRVLEGPMLRHLGACPARWTPGATCTCKDGK